MKIIQQDMLALKEGVLFHQVNCQGVMGGGIAYAFARKWPGLEAAYKRYIKETKIGGKTSSMLGKVFIYRPDPSKQLWIANVFGQNNVSKSSRMTSYDATVEAFELMGDTNVQAYFPYKMGCGLGGGNWTIYASIIEAYFPDAIICQHNA